MFNINITPFPSHIQQKQDWVSVARDAYRIRQAIKDLKQKETLIMNELKNLSHNENSKGGGFVFSKIVNKGRVQYSKIPELQNMDLDKYRGTATESWKLEKK